MRGDTRMRVMVLVKATAESEAGLMPTAEMFAAMGRFNEELVEAGIMQAGEGLKPSAEGKRVAFNGTSRTVIDGPFPATSELVAGFWLWQVKDMAEAVAEEEPFRKGDVVGFAQGGVVDVEEVGPLAGEAGEADPGRPRREAVAA